MGLGEVFLVIVFPLPKDMAAIREQGFLGKEKKAKNMFLAKDVFKTCMGR